MRCLPLAFVATSRREAFTKEILDNLRSDVCQRLRTGKRGAAVISRIDSAWLNGHDACPYLTNVLDGTAARLLLKSN